MHCINQHGLKGMYKHTFCACNKPTQQRPYKTCLQAVSNRYADLVLLISCNNTPNKTTLSAAFEHILYARLKACSEILSSVVSKQMKLLELQNIALSYFKIYYEQTC